MSKSIYLRLTSAIAIDGGICRAGSIVEVSELEAKNLLHRGKAVLATEEDGVPVADEGDLNPDFSKMKKAELLQFCEANDIQADDGMTKDEILAAIEAATQEAQ
jgi:hypothetical protein